METRSRKRAEATSTAPSSSSSSPPPSGPTTRSKRARLSSPSSSSAAVTTTATAPSSSTRSRSSRSAATTAAATTPMDTSTESSGFRRGGRGNRGNDNSNSDKGKEKEHEVRIRERDRARQQLNMDAAAAAAAAADEDDDNDSEDGNGGFMHPNMSSASSALQGLLRKLGAGLDDLLPSSGIGSGSSSHLNGRMKKILAGLRSDGEEGKQVEALTQLCEMLSIGTEDSLSTFSVDSFVPVLVGLLNHESNPDIMLLAARALTHLCDVLPSSCTAVVHYGAVSCFVARLLTIEYMDLAEQSLQALKKISQEHPTACLRAGALMAVLSYLDFFSTGVQRVALSTAANMCKKLPSDASDYVMEAVPLLTNLLQYHDSKVLEHASICLTRIAEAFASYPEKLDELCNHGLVTQAATLISTSNSGGGQASLGASTYTGLIRLLSTCASGSPLGCRTLLLLGISNILKDILSGSGGSANASISPALSRPADQDNDCVPGSARSRRYRRRSSNANSEGNQSEEVKNSVSASIGANHNSLESPTASFMLRETVSSCAKAFKDKHFPSDGGEFDVGVTDDLLHLKNLCTKLTTGTNDHKVKGKGKAKASGPCLGDFSASKEEYLIGIISEILGELSKGDGVSTFEFIGSGVVAALLNYFSYGYFSKEKISEFDLPKLRQDGLRRFKAFLEVALPSDGNEGKTPPMTVLIQKLQDALSSLERFPVVLSHPSRSLSGSARLSSGLSALAHPLKLRLCRAPGEKALRDYSSNIVLIDPLASLAAVEEFLWPRVQRSESGVPTPPVEAQKPPHAITFDSQGCILLDQESNDLTQSNMPNTSTETTVKNTEVIVTDPQGPSYSRETEIVPHVNSLEDNSSSIIAPSSVIDCLPETAPLIPLSGFTPTYTSPTSASPTVFVPLDFTTAGKLTFPTSVEEKNGESVDGIQDASKKLSEVKGSNRFANLASMEEKVAPEDVSSPSHSPVPTVVNDPVFVFNFSSPASQVMISEFGDPLAISSQGPTAATDTNIEGATSSYNSDMAQRSRGGRCLKPSQKLKDMEWFTITKKARRGRGRAALGHGSH
ncbi:hypothetical protein Bca52824_091722 [Brassica carinata]|uniref:HECT-type E3 ubiquitin transferase n=1 Tax=Brassica carinata TaxID=52824 RepID=A0A8X7TFT3_BRACI|nr:hypothetical protein Bca52824_091722 [Brassica carinata]